MSALQKFQRFIKEEELFTAGDKLLLAVSGGVDSVVLCELCQQAGFHFVIAHCNFQLRGAESDRDEQFVQSLSHKYNKKVYTKKFDTEGYASENKVSIQVAARELRYNWFSQLLAATAEPQQKLADYLLTAHHADDNIETVLMNFFKGTGITGLRGILPKHGKIIRPLLDFRKEELWQFAREMNLEWVEDSSNLLDKYSRNNFRQHIIPLVQKLYPAAEENIRNNIRRFSDVAILYQQAIEAHKKSLLEYKGNEVHIPVLKLKKCEPLQSILYEIIRPYQFTPAQTTEVLGLLASDSGKYVQSPTHRVIRNRKWLIIAPLRQEEAAYILIEKGEAPVNTGTFKLNFDELPAKDAELISPATVALLDHKRLEYPLLLRRWKTGDYFYPLGMKKKKKLARFFIDQKLSKTAKENVWVLESGKKIIWVIGHRIDDRYKITERTKDILQISVRNV